MGPVAGSARLTHRRHAGQRSVSDLPGARRAALTPGGGPAVQPVRGGERTTRLDPTRDVARPRRSLPGHREERTAHSVRPDRVQPRAGPLGTGAGQSPGGLGGGTATEGGPARPDPPWFGRSWGSPAGTGAAGVRSGPAPRGGGVFQCDRSAGDARPGLRGGLVPGGASVPVLTSRGPGALRGATGWPWLSLRAARGRSGALSRPGAGRRRQPGPVRAAPPRRAGVPLRAATVPDGRKAPGGIRRPRHLSAPALPPGSRGPSHVR